MSEPERREKLLACKRCDYVACICNVLKKHSRDCRWRVAVLDTKPLPCGAHGEFGCKPCNPCSCGGGP